MGIGDLGIHDVGYRRSWVFRTPSIILHVLKYNLARYILHRDYHNPQLKGLTAVASAVAAFKPHLVVLGGLQMLDTYPFTEEELAARSHSVKTIQSTFD